MAGNMKMMRQLQEMQEKMARIQEELGSKEVEGTSGGGVVTVRANGHQKLLSVEISPEAVDPQDVELLQDMVLAAANEALDRSRELAAGELGQLTAGMGLPPGLI
ncbi:MAG TPA: YbaB/EbfC family nucleoid-associated protein [Candidatus Solibacter sp.]|jgi:DNA-binding YbaB/EbfC family protein|nr:YbaB/EbfC family nucleoid-associated protein [Candidatus Solibacter sp.]